MRTSKGDLRIADCELRISGGAHHLSPFASLISRLASYLKSGSLLLLLFSLSAFAFPQPLTAQDLRVTSRVDRTRLRIGENLVYTLIISGAGTALPQPGLPPVSGFKSVGQYMTPEPGGSGLAYHYLLTPTQAGHLEVSDFSLRIAGQTYPVKGFSADVETGAAGARPAPQRVPTPQPSAPTGQDLLLLGSFSANRIYQGQPVIYTLHLYTRRSVRGLEMVKSPDFAGFQRVEDPDATKSPTRQTTRDGRVYLDVVVRRAALFPVQAGRLQVEPFTADLRLESSGASGPAQARVTGGQATLDVLPLPTPPPGFRGAVGSFTLAPLTPVPARVDMGQPFTVALRIEGAGFLPAEPMEGQTTPFFAPYPATSEDESGFAGAAYRTRRTLRVPVLPKVAGEAVLPPLRFVFFDPATKADRQLEAGGGQILVSGSGSASRPEVRLAPVIRELRPGKIPEAPWPGKSFWPLLLAPFLANLLLAAGLTLTRVFLVAPEKRRARALARQARRALRHAHRSLDVRRAETFHDALSQALAAALDLRTGRTTGGLSREQLGTALSEAELSTETISDLLDLREELETARYAPERPTRQDLKSRYDAVTRLVKESARD